ncbi:LOW QUALITY PROTEIN: hypothetical protein ACHAW6_003617, partial [Cyclotella cf. meneghiniana]
MNSADTDKWWKAMSAAMETLEVELQSWKLIKRESLMKVLPCTWAFWITCFPNCLVMKFQACICVHGDCQTEGVGFFETWYWVVQWSTVCTMMVLSTNIGLCTAQGDITAAFIHDKLKPDDEIFVCQPAGFQLGMDLVLSLNCLVYGIHQAPFYFFQHLQTHMECHWLHQSIGILVSLFARRLLHYAMWMTFSSMHDQDINTIGNLLKKDGIMIWKEGSVERFLGVDIQSIGSTHLLTQTGLTKHIVEALGLYSSFSTATCTPAEMSSLPKDSLGPLLLVPSTMLLWSACCFICVDTHIPTLHMLCISVTVTPFTQLGVMNWPLFRLA